MKILQLDLTAFGQFTDVRLDLSEGDHGLHIVYGVNEAGKSTTLRALQALLFGIPTRTDDAFKHDMPNLRLGGRIRHSDGAELAFVRRKGLRNTLLDNDEQAIGEDSLGRFLAGVGAEVFETMFGIDHERLVQGSEAILRGGGGVGESLFSAALGGASTRRILAGLDAEADDLFLARGRKQVINQLVSEYESARKEIRGDALSSQQWSEHDRALAAAEEEREGLVRRFESLAAERRQVDRIARSVPNLVRRSRLLARIEELGEVVVLSGDFGERRLQVTKALDDARQALERGRTDLETLQAKARTLDVPHDLIEHSARITDLHQRLGSHRKAVRDRSKLQGQLDQLLADAEPLLAQLHPGVSLEDAGSLRPTAVEYRRVKDLAADHASVIGGLDRAEKNKAVLKNRRREADNERAGIEAPKDASELARAMAAARRDGDLEGARLKVLSARDLENTQIEIELERLGPGPATAAELERAAFPLAETIDRFDADLRALEAEEKMLGERLEAERSAAADLAREIDELQRAGEVPTEHELVEARDRREREWQLVRRVWLGKEAISRASRSFDTQADLADAYEEVVRAADEVADRLRREADRVATMAELVARQTRGTAERATLEARGSGVAERLELLRREWHAAWSPVGMAPGSPREMRAWSARKDSLLKRIENQRSHDAEAQRLADRITAHRHTLAQALGTLDEAPPGGDETLGAVLDRCSDIVVRLEEAGRRRSNLEQRMQELDQEIARAGLESDQAASVVEQWRVDWGAAVSVLGLAPDVVPSVALAVLDLAGELYARLDDAQTVRSRIRGIERDAAAFEADLENLVRSVAPGLAGKPVEEAAARLNSLLTKATSDAVVLEGLEQQIDGKKTECAEAQRTIEVMVQRLGELCAEAGCETPDELAEAQRRSRDLRDARDRLEALEEQLIEHCGTAVEQLVREAEGADPDELQATLDDLDHRIAEIEGERTQLDQAIGSERQILASMDGGDRSAMAAERAQTLLAEIRRHAQRFLRLRLASVLLRREVELYRARNQAPLLLRASELFGALTLGSFTGLATAYDDKDEPVLEGVRGTGARVGVVGMSAGTRDQLYLALRLASLEKYLVGNEPMPFVVDDILISFDDRRSAAALEVLGELSKKTQVLFFTHHRRLVELAAESAGEVVVLHEL